MIKELLWPEISKQLPANITKVTHGILRYFDRYSNIFSSTQLTNRPLFNDADRDLIYMAIGITADEFNKAISESETFHSDREVSSNPFYVACFMCARWCQIHGKKKEAVLIIQYMAANIYSSIHYKYLSLNCSEAVMAYTANHVDGTRLIETGSLGAMIKEQVEQCFKIYADRIKKGDDEDIQYFIAAISTRLNNRLRPIFSAYYKFKESGSYLNKESEELGEENYRELDNDLYMIDRVVNAIYLQLNTGKVPSLIYQYATTSSGISSLKFRTLMEDIIDNEKEADVRKYISSIIEYFHYYAKNSLSELNSNNFSNTMLSAYASSTTSEHMAYIKDSMDRWLKDYAGSGGSVRYGKTAQATYKKAIYTFFVYMIKTYR